MGVYDIVANVSVTAENASHVERIAAKERGILGLFPMTLDYTVLFKSAPITGLETVKAELDMDNFDTIEFFLGIKYPPSTDFFTGKQIKGTEHPILPHVHLSENKVLKYTGLNSIPLWKTEDDAAWAAYRNLIGEDEVNGLYDRVKKFKVIEVQKESNAVRGSVVTFDLRSLKEYQKYVWCLHTGNISKMIKFSRWSYLNEVTRLHASVV